MTQWITGELQREAIRAGDGWDRVTVEMRGSDGRAVINLSPDDAIRLADQIDLAVRAVRARQQ
ncbi:hypothetical protein FYJ24_07050 [Actinomycetaceae bacterium WB03_NA08]|uniref:Uncharacterized protein n=1 Tax=Scrofimicrobium canadense TaxID=2652290 RepID=A0A6N7W5D6_9ACTO|nr:hypothetical protein [Scrofimicrobium canadense]MSS84525.1 hypothetical protein [Scrofimicrobium canadense]